MGKDVGDECVDDLWLAFGFEFERVEADITDEANNVVTRRKPAHCFTEEHALNSAPNLHASPLSHIDGRYDSARRFQRCCDGMRRARLNLLEAFSQAMTSVSSTI
jgi:hypothetical protein